MPKKKDRNRKDGAYFECGFCLHDPRITTLPLTAWGVYAKLWITACDTARTRLDRSRYTDAHLARVCNCDVRTLRGALEKCCKITLIGLTDNYIEVYGVDTLNAIIEWKDSDVRWDKKGKRIVRIGDAIPPPVSVSDSDIESEPVSVSGNNDGDGLVQAWEMDIRRVEVVIPGVSGSGSGSEPVSVSVGDGLVQAWEMDILGKAGLPGDAIPIMSKEDKNRPDGAGWKALDETIRWAEAEYGGADAVRSRLVELCRQHKDGKLKLFSLKATLNSPDLMRPKPPRETLEEYHARLARLPG